MIERGEDQEKEEINYADFLNNVGFFFFFFKALLFGYWENKEEEN